VIVQGLPRATKYVIVPPIKCQGIKTRLVQFILSNISWHGKGRWIEPFLGSGVVLFNVQPERALVNDINPHIIRLYQMIYNGSLSSEEVRAYLTAEGKKTVIRGRGLLLSGQGAFQQNWQPFGFYFSQ